ncbi:MAG: M90 family metallopeptidase [Pseudomonadota bacterium]
MLSIPLIGAALVIVPIAIGVSRITRNVRRKRLMKEPATAGWHDMLMRNVALFRVLPDSLRQDLYGHMHNFLKEKRFEGCGGLEMSDEIKVTIAAQACMLLLNRKATYFPKCDVILVYPSAYLAKRVVDMGTHHIEEDSARLGESWTQGVVVLAWDHVKQKTLDMEGGHNVVLHEFAHQLDQEDGRSDGAPILDHRSSYAAWARVLGSQYDELKHKAQNHIRDVMDLYGATNAAEFFAVATETFFEKGKQLKDKHPELYEELKEYYKLDPAEWNT